ncbi:MAG: M28 family peptidase [Verrucomicrobia bacterium]|nr:M28 family peptidase [Verrucomicrobiota bacterium]
MRARHILVLLLAAAVLAGGWFWLKGKTGPQLGGVAYEHTKAILAHGPRPVQSDALAAVRGYVKEQLEKCGWAVQAQPFERSTSVGIVKFENLRARFAGGEDPWQRPITGLLCAHIDSKSFKDKTFLGADDAASACGAILEIAAILAKENPDSAKRLELVFFDGEEAFGENLTVFDGLYGSRYYASEWRAKDKKPTFGILLDMIGHKNLKIALPSDTPETLREAVMAAAKAESAAGHFAMAPGPIIDDHLPLNLAGIPTVDMIGDFTHGGWWHTSADSLELIDPKSLDISIRVTLRVLRDRL